MTINSLTNLEIAKLLRKVAAAYTILGENRFKIIAYDNAATAVEHATSELKDLFDDNNLSSVPGLGPSISTHLTELFQTGKSKHFDQILGKVNPAIFPLLEVPGVGPKKAQKMVEELGISDQNKVIDLVERAAHQNKIAGIESFGAKSQQDILENIQRYRQGSIKENRMLLPQAAGIAGELISYLKSNSGPELKRVDTLGSLRRCVTTVGDIDLSAATTNFGHTIEIFINYPKKVKLIERGPTGASLLLASGRQADLRVAKPEEYGAMLQYFTGSKYHNIRLRDYALSRKLTLNEYGVAPVGGSKKDHTDKLHKFPSEEKLYNFLGMDYIPPELREDAGEIDAARKHNLPHLVELKDIKGDLHTHSNYDLKPSHDYGVDTMEDMLQEAKKLGYDYFGFTEHNPKSMISQDEIITILKRRKEEIEQLKMSIKDIQPLTFLEVDIQPDGNLAIPKDGFQYLDAVVASIHSSFSLTREQMTKRVINALKNPNVKILGHPTGRLLEQREGYELDWNEIYQVCLDFDVGLEINAHPYRLDISDTLVREAVKQGVLLCINTDSHDKESLTNMQFGVSVARRGWAEAGNIINTWSVDRLQKWLKKR